MSVARDIEEINKHIAVLNDETGDLRDKLIEYKRDINNEMLAIKKHLVKVETNVEWLMKSYWVVAGASIGGLVAALIGLLVKI